MSAGDEEIARRLRRDEPGAFDAFFDRYAKPLLGYLTRMLHDREAAEDVLQETMVRVCRAVGDYEERGTFRAWVYRIATNLALTELRRRRWTSPDASGAECRDLPDTRGGTALDRMLATERDQLIQRGMRALPDSQRSVLLLRIRDQMGIRDIAQTLCVPEGTVKSRLHHAVRALRDFVRNQEDGEAGEP